MSRRTYGQNCPLAVTMDVVGERWTLLILRELTYGPKRYGDLLERLPGIGTNLLASRLKDLTSASIVRRRRGATLYELAAGGHALLPALFALAQWGSSRNGRSRAGIRQTLRWGIFALGTRYRGDGDRTSTLVVELRFRRETHTIRIVGARFDSAPGPAALPDVHITGDLSALLDVAYGHRPLDEAIAARLLRIEGRRAAVRRFVTLFGLRRALAA